MAKTPSPTDVSEAAQVQELRAELAVRNEQIKGLTAQLEDNAAQHDAEVSEFNVQIAALQKDYSGLVEQVIGLQDERNQQHKIIVDLHERLTAAPVPPAGEKVIMARNARKYGA